MEKPDIFTMNNNPPTGRIFTKAGKAALLEQEKFIYENARIVLEFINQYEPNGAQVRNAISRSKGDETTEIMWRLLDKNYITITPDRRLKITDSGLELL